MTNRRLIVDESNKSQRIFLCVCFISGKQQQDDGDTPTHCAKRFCTTQDAGSAESSGTEPRSTYTNRLQQAGGSSLPSCSDDDDEDEEGSTGYVVKRVSALLCETEPYVLDVDLDFFSCKNPFKELYSQVRHGV